MNTFKSDTRRVIVIAGADSLTALATARAISHLPVEIWGTTCNASAPSCTSNIWDKIIDISAESRNQIENLIALAPSAYRAAGKPILLFSQDDLIIQALNHLQDLEKCYSMAMPDATSIALLMDKTRFHSWAAERGYPTPRAEVVSNYAELSHALENIDFPCILKPLLRTPAWDQSTNNEKLIHLASPKSMEHHPLFPTIFDLSERYLVQEWIPGDDSDVYFCLFSISEAGSVLGKFCGRKVLQWPPLSGSTAICTEHKDHELERLSEEILLNAGLKGLGSIEYKKSAINGKYYITEPTVGRNDFQSPIAVHAGINLTALLVTSMLPPQKNATPPPRLRKVLWLDEIGCLRYMELSPSTRKKLLISLIRFCPSRLVRCSLFSFNDPRPFLSMAGRLLLSWSKKISRKITPPPR